MAKFSRLTYPEAPRGDDSEVLHGVTVADPFRRLEELDASETRAWIDAQNRLTSNYLETIQERGSIERRLTELWNYEKYGVPFRHGDRYFFTYNDGLRNQSSLLVLDNLDGEPRLLLDPNLLSEDGTVALTGYAVSEDGEMLAYGLSAAGSDWQEWRVRDIATGEDHPDHLRWVKFSGAAWTPDHQGFFYSRYDEPVEGLAFKGANYFQKLYYHRLGTPQADDQLVYERPDQKEWGFGGEVSEDGRYLVISVWKGTHRENGVLVRDLQAPGTVVTELLTDFDASYGFVGNTGPVFFFHTDADAPLSRLVAIDINNPGRDQWRQIIPERPDALQSVSLIGGHFIALYLRDAAHLVVVYDLSGDVVREVELPAIGSVSGFGGRHDQPETFFQFTSFATPGRIYRYDVATGESQLFREPRLTFDPDTFVTEQVFAESRDGTRIPLFLSYRRDLVRDGDRPTYLYGYGGFNIPLTPTFSPAILAWIEMGGIYAQASLRGGGEYGKTWHEAGTRAKKQNVFDDFIASAEWLIANSYTSTRRLAIGGGSNGGLLVGACLTQRPDLFGACVAQVGVLDMLRFHKWTIGWAWVSDYGSPDDPAEFETLRAYSPYHNIKPGTAYPPTLITTGDHDDRVFPAHSFKFAAALQAAQGGPAPVLIRIETRAGHGAGKPTSKLIEERADIWAFLTRALEMPAR
jgi:prolyl oligopeptidase